MARPVDKNVNTGYKKCDILGEEAKLPVRYLIMSITRFVVGKASSPVSDECATVPPGLYRYHASANDVLCVGVVTGIVFYAMGWLPPWGGFLIGAVPTFVLAAIAHTLRDE